jgi:diguanylate cyclase (GGDEF)-like protein
MNAQELEKLATVDSMTGLFNRRHFFEMAEKEWQRFQRYQRPLTMLMVDVDRFKHVNDKFGHAIGDSVLTAVAATCFEDKRASDIVGRIVGEEFVVLLPETDVEQAAVVAERIRQKVLKRKFAARESDLSVTVSIGVAQATLSMSGVGALLNAADQALYRAKDKGRNRVERYQPFAAGFKEAAE